MLGRTLLVVAALAGRAAAGDCDPECRIADVRAKLARGELSAARDELLALHTATGRPDLLFALGQVELQLGRYEVAIRYYERFLATRPAEDQVALAQQAIGAARMRMVQPPPPAPPPPPPRLERRWDRVDTALAASGGAVAVLGAAALVIAQRLGNDTSGTLAAYDARLDRARRWRLGGIAAIAAGAATAGIALVRWRLDRTEIAITPGAITASRRW